MSKENLMQFVELASNSNYGDCVYSTHKKDNGYFEVVIKNCCHNLIVDLLENNFRLSQGTKGLYVDKN